jgi:hypothetical protein
MQHTEITLFSATLYYGEKKPNTTAMQRSKRRGTQDTVNSNSWLVAPPTAMQKNL